MMIFWFVQIGSALKKLFDDGVVKREDLWITSKLWCVSNFFLLFFVSVRLKNATVMSKFTSAVSVITLTIIIIIIIILELVNYNDAGAIITCRKMYQRHWTELCRTCNWTTWISIWYVCMTPFSISSYFICLLRFHWEIAFKIYCRFSSIDLTIGVSWAKLCCHTCWNN